MKHFGNVKRGSAVVTFNAKCHANRIKPKLVKTVCADSASSAV